MHTVAAAAAAALLQAGCLVFEYVQGVWQLPDIVNAAANTLAAAVDCLDAQG